ncbi:hypothetical protein ACFO4P_03650 [Epilithonimonas pallida]|uniref:Uncharacterized protein n=1 Tax=Epilithonimonas pallida TaxID=373671 RepID=A0ABY1R3S6_9FLAO|nr:hypothetical protein [Epilithonimonas pallida]SMP90874.1 hypothetical protein SAMN05421679_102468 [Epilithonimonas pallida]
MIKKEHINKRISFVEKYFTIIDEDVFIDYICIHIEDENQICLTIDSSGENIIIISFEEMSDCIKRTAIKYNIEKIIENVFITDEYYQIDDYKQLIGIKYRLVDRDLKISIGLDTLIYSFAG